MILFGKWSDNMLTKDLSLEERLNIVNSVIEDTIKTQSKNMILAENRKDDSKWLQAYELKSFCEIIKSILNGEYDITV